MPVDPNHINEGLSTTAILFSAAGGSLAGGGVVGVMARIIWAQFNRRLVVVETDVNTVKDKLVDLVRKDDCRLDRQSCAASLGRSIDEVKDMLKEIRKAVYKERN